MMSLFFGKIFFHRSCDESDFAESEQDRMLNEIEDVLKKYGVELARFEFAGLNHKCNPTGKCNNCGYLTLDTVNSSEELEVGDVYDDLREVIHLGYEKNGKFICYDCENWLNAQ